MSGDTRLASAFLSAHPATAARLLESMDADQAGEVLESMPVATAATVLNLMLPTSSARCAEHLSADFVAALVERLPSLAGAALLRHLPQVARDEVLKRVGRTRMAALKLLLRYPATAVGAWMEPRVLTLPDDCNLREASARLEKEEFHYPKIFVLDRGRKIQGAVRTLDLQDSEQRGPITRLIEPIDAFWARASVSTAHEDDIWERESAAPVVNRQEEFVGVVTYADLRKVHRQLLRRASVDTEQPQMGEFVELFMNGLDGAWHSLGDIIRSERPDRSRGT